MSTDTPTGSSKSSVFSIGILFIAAAMAGLIGAFAVFSGGGISPEQRAAADRVFEGFAGSDGSLAGALAASESSGKPAVVVAGADWCTWCVRLKADTIADPAVAAFLGERTVPVSIEQQERPEDFATLRLTSLPTTVVYSGGEVIGRIEGYRGPDAYMAALRDIIDGSPIATR